MNRNVLNYPDWKFPSKYAEEYSPLSDWMIFGHHTDGRGRIIGYDIAEANPSGNDVITCVPNDMAEKIVALRERFTRDLMLILSGQEAKSDVLHATIKEWAAERRTFLSGETPQLREISERMVALVGEKIT